MNSFWGRNTRLRVIVAVADNRHEAVERQRWTQFLQYIRYKGKRKERWSLIAAFYLPCKDGLYIQLSPIFL